MTSWFIVFSACRQSRPLSQSLCFVMAGRTPAIALEKAYAFFRIGYAGTIPHMTH